MKGGSNDVSTETKYAPNMRVAKKYEDENDPYEPIKPLTHFSANIAQSMFPAYPQY